jgi:hypothetical protein
MAVNVNDVYTTVLYLLNKEQRGYIQPDEFNKLATQVQLDIFQDYFSDANQLVRKDQTNVQNDTEFFNHVKDIEYKLYPFLKESTYTYNSIDDIWSTTDNVYKIGDVIATYTSQNPNIESMSELTTNREYNFISRSKLTAPTKKYPLHIINKQIDNATLDITSTLKVYPQPNELKANVLLNPSKVYWGYSVGNIGQFVYDASLYDPITQPLGSLNFELDISEQNNIVMRILKYCGVVISDPQIVAIANNEIQENQINLKS